MIRFSGVCDLQANRHVADRQQLEAEPEAELEQENAEENVEENTENEENEKTE